MEHALLEIAKAIESLAIALNSTKSGLNWIDLSLKIIPALGVVFGIVSVIIGAIKIFQEIKERKKILLETQNQKERERIQEKLDLFFGPLKELSTESKILYDHFALKEKEAAKERGEKTWRTLRHLSQGKGLKAQDKAILDEIIKIINKQRRIIEKEGQLIENSQLAFLLGKFGSHVRLLSLAAEKKLDGRDKELEDIVFPKELDGAIETEIRKLQDKYETLLPSYKPDSDRQIHPIQSEQKEIIQHYNTDPQDYFRATAYLDMSELYKLFLGEISYGGIILDAGCGVGRDTRYFIKQGFRVVSFDASIEMVKLCRKYPFAYCLHKKFSDIDFIEEFEGIWASGSLIHLPENEFKETLYRLSDALKPGGLLFFSLKKDNKKTRNTVRIKTYFHNEKFVTDFIKGELKGNKEENDKKWGLGFKLLEVKQTEGTKDNGSADWIGYFCRKPELGELKEI